MRRPTLLALVLAFAACGETTDPGPTFTDPDDLRLAIVGGDGQVGSVQEMSAALVAAVGPTGVLPDTLVARITDKSGGHANVPPNTVVNYVIPTAGCGAPWIDDATPDDSAYVATLWERPAGALPDLGWHDDVWGSACTLEARTVVAGEFKTDTMFTAIFTPGAVLHSYRPPNTANGMPEWSADRREVADQHGNEVPFVLDVSCDSAGCATVQGTFENYRQVPRSFSPVDGATGELYMVAHPADTFAVADFSTFHPDPDNPDLYRTKIVWR